MGQAEQQAAQWVIRISAGALPAPERARFEAWLRSDPAHAEAFARAQATWASLDALKTQAPSAPIRRHFAPRQWGAIAAALACVVLVALLYGVGDPLVALRADYRTGPAELRTITLADGSQVDLAPASAISLQFSDELRQVTLLSGEAFFAAAPRQGAEHRPFAVRSQAGTTTALGTQFVVETQPEQVQVTAVEHRIEVATANAPLGAERVVLSPGESVGYDAQGQLSRVEQRDTSGVGAWRSGMLVFDSLPLRTVVAKLNRYRRGRVVVVNPQLADRRVSGVFAANDLDGAVDTIASELNARIVSAPGLLTLLF